MHFTTWQWILVVLGAFLIGLSKTGFAGIGVLFAVLFNYVMPAKLATGFVLPMLCFGDVVAVLVYRRHADWRALVRIFPCAAVGVAIGYFIMGRIDDQQARRLIGGILLFMVVLHFWRRWRETAEAPGAAPTSPWFAVMAGMFAGFATLMANASGPVMTLYFLAMRLPKMEFLGTAAVFYLLLNLFKVPFMAHLGIINASSLLVNLEMLPVVLVGTLAGKWLVQRINQKAFETVLLTLTFLGGLKLLF